MGSAGVHGLIAGAPVDTPPDALLGSLYDADFRRVDGRVHSTAGAPQTNPTSRVEVQYRALESESELRANASVWGIGGSLSQAAAVRHAYYRAFAVTERAELGEHLVPVNVSARATYYISAVLVGRLYEMHLSGSSSAVTAAVEGRWGPAEGGVAQSDSASGLQYSTRAIGFRAPEGLSVVRTEAEVRNTFLEDGPTVPILVVYSRVPDNFRQATRARRFEIVVETVVFPARKNAGQGAAWDAFDGLPEIAILVHGANLGDQRLSRTCPRDRLSCDLDWTIPHEIVLATDTPLWMTFFDVDVSENDPAGDIGLSLGPLTDDRSTQEMPPGGLERQFTTNQGVQVTLRVTER